MSQSAIQMGIIMNKRINALSRLFLCMLFMLTVLEPVKAKAVEIQTVRLNLYVSEIDQIDQCNLIDPVLSTNEVLHWVSLSIPEDKVEDRIAYYQSCPIVNEAYTDHVSKLALVPVDSDYQTKQWNLDYMDMEPAWEITTGSPDVIVAVIDTGVKINSPLSDFAADTVIKGVSVLSDPYTNIQEVLEDAFVGQYA